MVSSVWPVPDDTTSLNVIAGDESIMSVAVAVPVLDTLVSAGASSIVSDGGVTTGSVVSNVNGAVLLSELDAASVAMAKTV